MRALAAVIALSACSIPDKHALGDDAQTQDGSKTDGDDGRPVDVAVGPPYACLGQPLPTTAPAMFTISGESSSLGLSGTQPLAGVTLNGYVPGQLGAIITLTTDASGEFSVAVPSGGVPVDGHIVASLSSYLTTNVYPSRPFDSDTTVSVTMITASTMTLASNSAGVGIMANTAQVAVYVVDCNNMPIAGATVEMTNNMTPPAPTGTIRYFSGGLPNSSATATDATGTAIVFNTSGGLLTIHATAPAGTLRAHNFTAPIVSTQWTLVSIQP